MKKHWIRSRAPAANGFTLAEILVAVVIIGIAIAALVGANGAVTRINAAAINIASRASEIRSSTSVKPTLDFKRLANMIVSLCRFSSWLLSSLPN